ncbi:hypothetical protein FB451DRAFT_949962, partial [Mycena latifolia]
LSAQDQDSWGEGSTSSLTKPTRVTVLGGVLCQVANPKCQGVYLCSELDMSLLDGHERYEPNDDEMRELFEAEREVNLRETSSKTQRGGVSPCDRKIRLTARFQMNLDGMHGFIGCQNHCPGDSRTHRFITIHWDVKEEYLRELLANNGIFKSIADVNDDRQIVQSKIIQCKSSATITIFSPVERSDRRAIIYLTGPHNHPKFPSRKLSRQGRDTYQEAINTAGVTGLTVLKCDAAQSISKIFGGQIPAELDLALANARIKRKVIQDIKKINSPCGLGIEGVLAWQRQMRSLPHGKQYVWKVTSKNGEEIIITMLPYLADRIYCAKASLHDNTYARVHGTWKEWEIVTADVHALTGITIGRIYSQHEKFEVFLKMWPALWETIAHVTKAEVKFKFIDGEGLRAILVDGNKPQANALGAYLFFFFFLGAFKIGCLSCYPEPGIYEMNPKLILPNILRTCTFHLNQYAFPPTHSPFDRLINAKNGFSDWISDKDSIPWFFPSINRFLSNMSEDDWGLTPGDTNLNESAHPYTNQHTGTNLSLLEAIQRQVWMEAKLRAMEDNCVLVNHLNTKPHRDRRNVSCRASHLQQAMESSEARDELENIEDEIQHSTAQIRELREKKKVLQSTSGMKKTKR